jgi:sec-independent protein translocase protein TatA
MGGLSITHILFIGIVLLVFFGPSRLPGLGKSMGEAIRGFKKGIQGDEIDVTDAAHRRESLNPAPPREQARATERVAETERDRPTGRE